MSRQQINVAALRQIASACIPWEMAAENPRIGRIFPPTSHSYKQLNKKLQLTDQAYRMLSAMNDFDQRKVSEELLEICRYPHRPEADVGRKNVFKRLLRTRYPFQGYHFKIRYAISADNSVVVDDIFFDRKLMGPKPENTGLERNALYRVKRTGNARFTSEFRSLGDNSDEVVGALQDAWETSKLKPTRRIETRYAAVNGMQNELEKAAWLMGTHLDVAYPQANMDSYTLFHNPTDGVGEDVFECIYDKRAVPANSHNVHHFASVLHDTQMRGHKTHWVAHSQGAILFSRAVALASRKYGASLNCHSVSLHGVGCHLGNVRIACRRAGITITEIRNNPFDLVPNVAGGNDLSRSGLARSLKFKGLVFGDDPLASPHTLPYLGLETYIDQLEFSKNDEMAAYAKSQRLKPFQG